MATVAIGFIGRITTSAQVNRTHCLNNFSHGVYDAKVSRYLKGSTGKYFENCVVIIHSYCSYSENPTFRWVPSQKGILLELPHLQKEVI